MGKVINALIEIISKSINLKLWFYVVLVLIFGFVLFGVAAFALLLPAIAILFLSSFSFSSILIAIILGIIFLIVLFLFSAIVDCIALNIARDYLETGNYSWSNAWNKGKNRIFALIKVKVLIGVLLGIIFLLLMLPALGYFLHGLKSIVGLGFQSIPANQSQFNSLVLTAFLPALIWFFVGIIIYFLIFLILSPILLIIKQVTLWEQKGTIEILRRAFQLGKENYWENFAFFILFSLLVIVIVFVFSIISFPFSIMTLIPVAAIAIIGIIILFFIEAIQIIWLGVLNCLFSAKIYLMDLEKEKAMPPMISKPNIPSTTTSSSLEELVKETPNISFKPKLKTKPKTKTLKTKKRLK